MRFRYYQYHHPYPAGYYYHHLPHHTILDDNNNVYERNPYPLDGPYLDRRLTVRSNAHEFGEIRGCPYYDSRYCFHGRVDPYTSYSAYYETPLLAFPQPPPPPRTHPLYSPETTCTIM